MATSAAVLSRTETAQDADNVLVAKGLTKEFAGFAAVKDVNLAVRRGSIHALIGPNGAGKTTFVSLLSGRTSVTDGRISFQGQDITAVPAFKRVRLGIAYTFQITSVFSNLTAWDNVALPLQRTSGSRGSALDEAVAATLRRVGLADRDRTPAANLSYGHQRLLEVAMGLALRPRLLILDEPTQGLSDQEIADFVELVRDIARTATVLLIEHNMDVVMQLAGRITVFEAEYEDAGA